MTTTLHPDRAVSDLVGLIVDLVMSIERQLASEQIRTVAVAVSGGRAKARRLASALAQRPEVLTDGRSPAPRAVGELLIALRKVGASAISPPCCAECGKQLRTLQRRGQDWYCAVCGPQREPCVVCGNTRIVASRDRIGQPRCPQCPDVDGRDLLTVIDALITELDPRAGQELVADAVRRSAWDPHTSRNSRGRWKPTLDCRLVTAILRRCARS